MRIDKFNSALPLVDFAVKAQDAVGDIEKVKIRQFKLSYSKTRTNKNQLNA